MKGNETDYLDKLFSSSSDVNNEAEVDFPLVDVPEELSEKLYAISDSVPFKTVSHKRPATNRWPLVTSLAATLFVGIVGIQFYQQQQTLKQLEQAQADLATALHYLGEANRITQAQVRNSVRDNMKNSGVKPAIDFGRDVVIPNLKELDPETNKPNRTL